MLQKYFFFRKFYFSTRQRFLFKTKIHFKQIPLKFREKLIHKRKKNNALKFYLNTLHIDKGMRI